MITNSTQASRDNPKPRRDSALLLHISTGGKDPSPKKTLLELKPVGTNRNGFANPISTLSVGRSRQHNGEYTTPNYTSSSITAVREMEAHYPNKFRPYSNDRSTKRRDNLSSHRSKLAFGLSFNTLEGG